MSVRVVSFRKTMILMFIRDTLTMKEWEYKLFGDGVNVTFILGNKEYDTRDLSDDECWDLLDWILKW